MAPGSVFSTTWYLLEGRRCAHGTMVDCLLIGGPGLVRWISSRVTLTEKCQPADGRVVLLFIIVDKRAEMVVPGKTPLPNEGGVLLT